ncbi:MAG: hypothetical protein CVU34_08500 [Betaproteobacteria bacterium HGW-Betaproteobacteria-7]|jgi:hypothetical protein|nr:MAG: hypothetical protein CVU34_08500 [Betaproteobacteria bacterium HGW-Betaproteobacteria-7]
MRSIKNILYLMITLMASSQASAGLPQCGSFVFSIEQNGQTHSIDVAEIRKNRQELYELLRDDSVRSFYLHDSIAHMARMHDRLTMAAAPLFARKEELQKFVAFMVTEINVFTDDWMWDCGSAIDSMVGELSLMFTKSESEELVVHLRNPIAGRFLQFASRSQQAPMPKEILESFSGSAFLNAKTRLVAKCRSAGFESAVCDALQKFGSARPSGSAAQPINPQDAAR